MLLKQTNTMEANNTKKHWETVYETKSPAEVSWTQEIPKTALDFIFSSGLPKDSKIIDIGGGDSTLVDHLINQGFENITVLDISAKAIERAKLRLGKKAEKVNWIVSDITNFQPDQVYDIWHDRATFHFLTTDAQVEHYLTIAGTAVSKLLIIGTFSENGPKKCSGLEVRQYNESTLTSKMETDFEKLKCIYENHTTPFNTQQHFVFCCFKRK